MRRFASLLALTLALALWPHDAEARQPKVTMYGASWCGPCKIVRSYLQRSKVTFEYRDIDQPNHMAAFRREVGRGGIPVTIIGGREIKGANTPAIAEALGLNPPAPRKGQKLYGGQPASWWTNQFRALRAQADRVKAEIAKMESSELTLDNVQEARLEARRQRLEVIEESLTSLFNDASRFSLPRKYRN